MVAGVLPSLSWGCQGARRRLSVLGRNTTPPSERTALTAGLRPQVRGEARSSEVCFWVVAVMGVSEVSTDVLHDLYEGVLGLLLKSWR